jgi:hypothetical protein
MRITQRLSLVTLVAAMLLATTGCPDKTFTVAPVSGKVTLNGKPLPGAKMQFQPVASGGDAEVGGGSYGKTDEQGNFKLALILQDGEGAIVGEHRVTIMTGQVDPNSDQSTITGEKVPPQYRDGSITFTVPPEGTTEANFKMTR